MFVPWRTVASLLGALAATSNAACAPSATHICITIQDGSYYENRGQGPNKASALELNANTRFEFEMEGPGFAANPFAITSDSSGIASTVWVDGINGISPAMKEGDVLRFTPPERGPSKLYYASTMTSGMGNKINIPLACMPSKFHLCVFFFPGNPGYYMIDQGSGKQRSPKLVLTVSETYTFEMVGNSGLLGQHPMVLSTSSGSPITSTYSNGVTGDYPGGRDGAEFNFTGSRTEPSDLFYGSSKVGVEFGLIYVDGACYSGPTHVCIGITAAAQYSADQVQNGEVRLIAGTKYTFETVEDTSSPGTFQDFPFRLYDSNNNPLAEPQGVTGMNPCQASGDKLYFVADPSGPELYTYGSSIKANMGGSVVIAGACSPSEFNICVTYDGVDYNVNQGDAEGARAHATLILMAGSTYTFELAGDPEADMFTQHPFALSSADQDNGSDGLYLLSSKDGVTGDSPASADDARLVFTPSTEGLRTYYYQSTNALDQRIGGKLTILGTCISTETHICVTFKNGQFSVNQGPGPIQNGQLNLRAGTNYTFEAVGNAFQSNAFALTISPTGGSGAPVMVAEEGVSGASPMVGDGDLLIYTPRVNGPSTIYYQSLATMNIGGQIHIKGSCTPSKTNICVSVISAAQGSQEKHFVMSYVGPDSEEVIGPTVDLTLQLDAGNEYTFEITGDLLDTPFAIATKETGETGLANPYLTVNEGVEGKNPATVDGDVLVFKPSQSGANLFYYGTTKNTTTTGDMGGSIYLRYTCIPRDKPNLRFCVFHKRDKADEKDPGVFLIDQGAGPKEQPEMLLNKEASYTFTYAGPDLIYPFALKYIKTKADVIVVNSVGMILNIDQDTKTLDIPEMETTLPASVWPSKTTIYYGTNQCAFEGSTSCPDIGNTIRLQAGVPTDLMTNSPTGVPTPEPTRPPQRVPTNKPSLPFGFQQINADPGVASNCTGSFPSYTLTPIPQPSLEACLQYCSTTTDCDTVNFDSSEGMCYMDTCALKKCEAILKRGFGKTELFSMQDGGCIPGPSPTPASSPQSGDSGGGPGGAVVAVLVVGILAVCGVVAFVFMQRRKKMLTKDEKYTPMNDMETNSQQYVRMDV